MLAFLQKLYKMLPGYKLREVYREDTAKSMRKSAQKHLAGDFLEYAKLH